MASEDVLVARGPTLVRWGAVFAGAISAVALFALATSFWLALAYDSVSGAGGDTIITNVSGVADNLEWFISISAIVAMLLGGFIAGWFSGLRGAGAGALSGFVAWGVTLLGAVVFGAPSVLGGIGIAGTTAEVFAFGAFWAAFVGIALGFVAAVVGGAIGGAVRRPGWLFRPQAVEVTDLVGESPGFLHLQGRRVDLREANVRGRETTREPTGASVSNPPPPQ